MRNNMTTVIISLFLAAGHVVLSVPPDLAADPTASSVTTTAAQVSWDRPAGTFTKYKLSLSPAHGSINPFEILAAEVSPKTILSGLTPGTEYIFTVRTTDGATDGNPKSVTFYTKPNQVNRFSVQFTNADGTSATVLWSKPSGPVDSYELYLTPATAGMSVPNKVTVPTAELENLTPGTTYTLNITTKVGTTTLGDVTRNTFTTTPNPVNSTTITTPNLQTTSAQIAWVEPDGNFEVYEFRISPSAGVNIYPFAPGKGTSSTTLSNLDAGTTYTFIIKTNAGSKSSTEAGAVFTTRPNQVNGFSVQYMDLLGTSATATWSKPSGNVDSYLVSLIPATAGMTNPATVTTPTASLTKLIPGTTYTLNITTKVGNATFGASATDLFTTVPNPVDAATITIKNLTSSSVTISWGEPMGNFDSYELTINPIKGVDMLPFAPSKGTAETQLLGLEVGTSYTFTIKTKARIQTSAEAKKTFATQSTDFDLALIIGLSLASIIVVAIIVIVPILHHRGVACFSVKKKKDQGDQDTNQNDRGRRVLWELW